MSKAKTPAPGTARLRLSLNAHLTDADLDAFFDALDAAEAR